MNTKIQNAIKDTLEFIKNDMSDKAIQAANLGRFQDRLLKLEDQLSERIDINLYGNSYWFTTEERNDVSVLMTLAPQWKKREDSMGIDYSASVDSVELHIKTRGAALPPTCRVVEREVQIPARTEIRKFVECDKVEETVEVAT